MTHQFETRVCGIPCIVEILNYEPYSEGYFSGLPEQCYDSTGGCSEWRLLTLKGKPSAWLENKMSAQTRKQIDDEVFNYMEQER
jgi:hypothetical protein